jgi:uncharacterized protein
MNQSNIPHILKTCKTIAVVGLSPKAHRDSYEVAEYMQSQGYRIIPINPVAAASNEPILGNSADIPPIATEAVQIKAQVLWMQLGIENEVAKTQAESAGLAVVENRCLLIEHKRFKQLL